jgi:hypothetical protein
LLDPCPLFAWHVAKAIIIPLDVINDLLKTPNLKQFGQGGLSRSQDPDLGEVVLCRPRRALLDPKTT